MNEFQPSTVQTQFQDAIQALKALTHDHEKAFRLGVGQYILQRFFGGNARLFSSLDPHKDTTFRDFATLHAADLAELDLSEQTLRRCVRVRICYDLLPPANRDKLGWSATLQISTLDDPNQRARLAAAAVAEQWPVARVKQAVALAQQHRFWDAEPATEGLQLPEPRAPLPPQPGRLVTRTEKWSEEISNWRKEFELIDAKRLDKAQVERMKAAMAAVRGQLDELEGKLG